MCVCVIDDTCIRIVCPPLSFPDRRVYASIPCGRLNSFGLSPVPIHHHCQSHQFVVPTSLVVT